ncbi:MAG: hypothetical protein J6866_05125 [Victivallales bacterium]|nr:hypothetical protein [Victivallales bacterium]
MSWKIAMIGGGSVLWIPRLGCDLLLQPELDGSELVLVDIDAEAVKLCRAYLQECVRRLKCHWKISIASENSALKGADCVVVSISTGGFEAMDRDYTIPEKYGVYHSVSDTVGPGGIFRTLRNAPVFLGIAKKMARLCPDAWMVHVTNPLSQITRIVSGSGLVRCCGLCHEVRIAMNRLSKFLGLEKPEDLDPVFVGVNHFTLMTELYAKGIKNPMERLNLDDYLNYCTPGAVLPSGTVDDLVAKGTASTYPIYVNMFLKGILGAYPAADSPHIIENFPRFLNDLSLLPKFKLWRKGVLPARPDTKRKLAETLRTTLAEGKEPPEIAERSGEMLCDTLVGLLSGEPRRIIATMPNVGQVDNLPRSASVETWAVASRSGVHPVQSGGVPMSALGFMSSVVAEQELTCAAAVKRDRALVRQALFASPLLHQKENVDGLMQDLFDGEKQWLDW